MHPESPQSHTLSQMVRVLEEGGLIAYPTDSCYALGCVLGSGSGVERVRRIRQLGDRHHFTLVIPKFSQLGTFVEMDNRVFHTVRATTPGPYIFILKATREAPKTMQYPKRRTIGVRIFDHRTTPALLDAVGSSPVSSILLLPSHPEPFMEGWTIEEPLDHELGTALGSDDCGLTPTTVVDPSGDEPEAVRAGTDDLGLFG